jgi:hypothetical protein
MQYYWVIWRVGSVCGEDQHNNCKVCGYEMILVLVCY